jgi:hypothetical protein
VKVGKFGSSEAMLKITQDFFFFFFFWTGKPEKLRKL